MQGLDTAIFRAINNGPEGLAPIFLFFSEGNKWGWVRLFLLALFIGLLWNKKTRWPAVAAMAAWLLANLITDVLKAAFMMPRPTVALGDANVRVAFLTSYGTASAHSANMAAVAFCLWKAGKGWGWGWTVVALMTGLSRIYVGVHFPYQVVLGWACGVFAGLMVWQLGTSVKRMNSSPKRPDAETADC